MIEVQLIQVVLYLFDLITFKPDLIRVKFSLTFVTNLYFVVRLIDATYLFKCLDFHKAIWSDLIG